MAGARRLLRGCRAAAFASLLIATTAGAAGFEVRGFAVTGDSPISAADAQHVLAPYIGTHEGVNRLYEAARALESELRARGYTFHRVVVPPQELAEGVVRLEVVSFRLGRVTVSGNDYSGTDTVLASLPPLAPGEALNGRELTRAVRLANTHPTRRVSVAVRESETPDHIDADVRVREARPWSLFVGVTNTGTEATGRARVLLGFQHANLFDRDHVVTATFTTSPGHVGDVRQYGLAYRVPLYIWASTVTLFATRSDADSGRVAEVFDVSGRGTFRGVHLRHLLLATGAWKDHLEVGIEDHLFEDRTTFAGGLPVGRDVRARPVSFGYGGEWEAEWGEAGFSLAYVRNLTSGSHQDATSYAVNGNGAKPGWDLLRLDARARRALPAGLSLRARLSAQLAGEALIAGERIGLAGSSAVRGFGERDVTGDDGVLGTIELRSPPIAEGVHALAFLDAARYRLRGTPVPGIQSRDTLASAGVGVRMSPASRFGLSLDLARVIDGAGTTRAGDYGLHFNALLRF